jgi:hypothetical protein
VLSLASLVACLRGRTTLPGYITSRKQIPDYITAKPEGPALPVGQAQAGYYYQPVQADDGSWHIQVLPYLPMPGDMLLFDDHNKTVTFLYEVVGSGPPLHSAMIFARPDGTPALLEAGPNFIPHVFILEPLPRMRAYHGSVMIRRPRQPLSPDQSANLTRFALSQEGKDYALMRLFLQGTPIRCRTGLRKQVFARTCLDRHRWTCSELAVAAGVSAGLLDRRRFPANAMYPRDVCYDEHYDLSTAYNAPVLWSESPVEAALAPDRKGKSFYLVDPKTGQAIPQR